MRAMTFTPAGGLLWLFSGLTVALAGCQTSESGDASEGSLAGAPLWAPGQEWGVSERPVLIIGALDGPEAIGSVGRALDQSGIVLFDDGRVAIADGVADEIRVYDGSGTRLATVGRTGDGPGEFRRLRGILAFGGDSLLAWDSRLGASNGRLSVLTAGGRFVRTISLSGFGISRVIGVTEERSLLVLPQTLTPSDWVAPEVGEYREPRLYERLSLSGQPLGSFGPLTGPERVAVRGTQIAVPYFARNTYITVGKRAFYTGDSGSFEISAYDPETGEVVRYARRPFDLVPVAPEELSETLERWRALTPAMDALERGLAIRQRRTALRRMDAAEVPARETHPAFSRIIEDPDENLWVQHAAGRVDSLQTWSVFNHAGSWLGEVGLPADLNVWAIGRDAVGGVITDEFEVQYVHVYRLIK